MEPSKAEQRVGEDMSEEYHLTGVRRDRVTEVSQ